MAKVIKLTKGAIEALNTPGQGKRDTYHFEGVPGLQLRVTNGGVKTFSVFKRIKGGSPERITLGRFPDWTPEKAKQEAMKHIADLVNGKSPADATRTGKQEITLGELLGDFLQHRQNRRGAYLSEASKRDYKSSFDLHLNHLAKRRLSKIKDAELGTIHTKLGREHPARANRVIALASSMFSYAKEKKLFSGENPASSIKKFPENSRDRFIQADELPRFFQAVAAEENEIMRDYILLSLLTGARRSNVLAMRWQDVNLDRGEWRLLTTKNGTPQTVTLSPEAMEILRNRIPAEPATFVFPGVGSSGHLAEPKKGWKRILERAGIDDLRIHDLRRTLGSWQAKQGASLAIIGKSLNHKNQSTTAIYARLDLDPVRDSVNTATSAMLAAAGLKPAAEVVKLRGKKGA